MREKQRFNVIIDVGIIDSIFGVDSTFKHKTPFNLKSELRNNLRDPEYFLAQELETAIHRNVFDAVIFQKCRKSFGIEINCVKVRISSDDSQSGKSGGYRCIILLDYISNNAYLLSVYPKSGSNRKDNLSKIETNKLKEMCDEYYTDIIKADVKEE